MTPTLKLLSLSNAIKYGSIHFAKCVSVFHVLTHDPPAAQTILATWDPLRPPSVVSGPEVRKVSGARVLRGAWSSRPRRPSATTLCIVLSCILHHRYTLTFNPLVNQMLSVHICSGLLELFIRCLTEMLLNRLLNR